MQSVIKWSHTLQLCHWLVRVRWRLEITIVVKLPTIFGIVLEICN